MEDDVLEQPALPESGDAGNTAADNAVADDHDLDDDLDLDSQEQPEEEDEEIEVDGKKFALPKSAAEKLKAERLMHADYTQKTQAVAEERKAVQADRETVQRQQQEAQQYIGELAKAQSLREQIKSIDEMNLAQYVDTDPGGVMKYQEQRRLLEQQLQETSSSITQKQQQNALNEQQGLAKQIQEADAYFKREIPNWSPERSNRLQQYAVEIGLSADQLGRAVVQQPALAKLLHKAELFDQLEKKQAAAKPKAPVQEKPVTRITATRASPTAVDPAKLSDADWYNRVHLKNRKS